MSTQNSRPALPSAVVDRLFARFAAIYGAQRMAGSWGNVDVVERNATWAEGLGSFDLDVIGDAVREIAEDGSGWPPSLPEFAAVCQRHAERPCRNMRALPVPRRTDADLAHGREQMARIKAMLRTAVKPMPSRVPGEDDCL